LDRDVALDVRRAQDRFCTVEPGRESRHAFSFGPHWDAANTGFGPLVLHDEHRLAAGAGFPPHPHAGVEVVSWVLAGVLEHEDSLGQRQLLRPGQAQVLAAGDGVRHAERNGGTEPLAVVQAWLAGDSGPPRYASADVSGLLDDGLVPVASGRPQVDAPLRLRTPFAVLHVARLHPGGGAELPDAPLLHVHVAAGEVVLAGAGPLTAGDAARLTGTGGGQLTAVGRAELLVWALGG
jgi:redox-sensitive bicupin YhaK (pirin superfamily)